MTQEADMLNLDKIVKLLILLILIQACSRNSSEKNYTVSVEIPGKEEYSKIYQNAVDSLDTWILNQLGLNTFKKGVFECELDSLLCFDKSGTRMITAILMQTISPNSSDGLIHFYGEKINHQWYFFRGASIVIPRSMISGHNEKTPLSFEQLHEIALKEVYSPYLTESGEINEEWFAQHFEGPGWGDFNNQAEIDWALKGKRFSNKKDFYEYVHLQAAIGQWAARDTTQPIKRLEKTKTVLP